MLLQKLLDMLVALMEKGIFDNRYIVIFGANAPGTVMINYLEKQNIKVDAVIDNNTLLHGKHFMEISISSPEEVLSNFKENALIMIASKYYDEMKQQLEQMGYKNQIHILQMLNLSGNVKFDTSIDAFQNAKETVKCGLSVYQRIKKKYGDTIIVMAPVRPNGDVYIIASYLDAYAKKMSSTSNKPIVLTVIGNACEASAKLFNIEHIEKLSWDESAQLAAYANFLPHKIKVINPYISHLETYQYIDGYRGLTFLDIMKHGLLGLTPEDTIVRPEHEYRGEVVQEVFDKYELREHNTVILAPYANSIPQIRWDLWEKVAEHLKNKNYIVCTNCGTKEEKPVRGTKPVMFSFRDAVAVIEKAGYLIAYRSGFCDIVAQSKCKKIIVYPHHFSGLSSLRDFFGMEHELYRQEELIQIEHTFATTDELVDEIVKHF
ncbi:hypothetical protein [Paenibacillus oralis]|nr:hypothetical protein [Paenibacillus oralis]